MRLTRRSFGQLVLAGSAGAGLLAREAWAQSDRIPLQPFLAQITRLLAALQTLGTPLPAQDLDRLRILLASTDADALAHIATVLDAYVLLAVELNPEMRVTAKRGPATAELYQGGWRSFLVRVDNHAGTTPTLRIKSPQGQSVGRRSSLAITGVHDFTNGAVDDVEARSRWIAIANPDAPPLTAALSGLALEYRIVQIYSRDAGAREATLQADAGYGEQDLGYRSSVPVLFHCLPASQVELHILDERGEMSIASLLVTDALHRTYPPMQKRNLPDLNFQPQVYRYNGETLHLPQGSYTVQYTRGPEYLQHTAKLEIVDGRSATLALQLTRWVTPAAHGYYSGDTHIHAAGCSHYESPTEGVVPAIMERQVDGEALDLGSVLNWGPGYDYQRQFFTGRAEPMHHAALQPQGMATPGMPHDAVAIATAQTRQVAATLQENADAPNLTSLVRYDIEVSGFPSSHCGHLVLLQMRDQHYPGTGSIDDWPSWNIPVLRWAKEQGAAVGYAHSAHGLVVDSTALPNLLMPPFNSMGANEFIADVTHDGTIDFISGCDLWPFAELNIWYHTLNCGYRTAFAGETDFPCITDACVGGGRSYVPMSHLPDGDGGYGQWIEALLHGDSYFGDGRSHIFHFAVNGRPASSTSMQLPAAAEVEVTGQVCALLEAEPGSAALAIQTASPYDKPYWHLERSRIAGTRRVSVELVLNGLPVAHTEIVADGSLQPVSFRVHIPRSSWIAMRVYPSSHTNPQMMLVAGEPVRASQQSAQWCRSAVDVCWEQKRQRIRPEELADAAAAYQHARQAYDRIVRESSDSA